MRIATAAVVALSLSVAGTSAALAQSQPNFGPNAPSQGDSFGKPPSGSLPPPSGARAYAYRAHSYPYVYGRRYHHRYYYR